MVAPPLPVHGSRRGLYDFAPLGLGRGAAGSAGMELPVRRLRPRADLARWGSDGRAVGAVQRHHTGRRGNRLSVNRRQRQFHRSRDCGGIIQCRGVNPALRSIIADANSLKPATAAASEGRGCKPGFPSPATRFARIGGWSRLLHMLPTPIFRLHKGDTRVSRPACECRYCSRPLHASWIGSKPRMIEHLGDFGHGVVQAVVNRSMRERNLDPRESKRFLDPSEQSLAFDGPLAGVVAS